jgi:dipeptidyl aminopeptidase/acylaminoacyl peptidase
MSRTALRPAAALAAAALLTGCYSTDFESARDTSAAQPVVLADADEQATPRFGNVPMPQAEPVDATQISLDASNPNAFGEFGNSGERRYVPVAGRAGYQQHSFVDEGFDADVAISPDAQAMAFASTRHSTRSDIYLQATSGLAVTKLTTDPADDAFPTFSPTGDRIAFCSNRSGSWDIYVMDRDGRNVTAVTQGTGHDLHPSFAPDGERIAFCRVGGRSDQWEIWVANIATGEQTMVGFGLFPDWSPRTDADVIAFQRARQRGGRWFSLWTMKLEQGEPTAVTEVAMSTNAALVSPSWSPDGDRLSFATVVEPTAGMPDTDEAVGRQDVWTVNADGTDRHRITDGKGTYATPAWASDGRVYFISDRGGNECVWSARAESTRSTPTPNVATKQDESRPPFASTDDRFVD